jgi:hypothetical protein
MGTAAQRQSVIGMARIFGTSNRARRLAIAALLLGMPCLAIVTLTNPLLQVGTIDPFVYTALLHDYKQVLHRYGATYYANRVAFTVPARAAIAWFGDAGGHFLLQATYLFAATLSGFVLGWRYFTIGTGFAAAAWVAFNPWLIRSLAWDYVEGRFGMRDDGCVQLLRPQWPAAAIVACVRRGSLRVGLQCEPFRGRHGSGVCSGVADPECVPWRPSLSGMRDGGSCRLCGRLRRACCGPVPRIS